VITAAISGVGKLLAERHHGGVGFAVQHHVDMRALAPVAIFEPSSAGTPAACLAARWWQATQFAA